jgi:hypothetical protein
MKIMLKELREAQGSLVKVLGVDLEFKLSYRLRRIADKVMSEMKQFEKFRNEMVEKYGEKDKVSGQTTVKKDKMEFFNKEIEKVLEEEVDLGIQLIPFDLIEKSGIKLSAIDQVLLERFMTEEKTEKKRP